MNLRLLTLTLTMLTTGIWASAQIQSGENIAVTSTLKGKVRGYVHNNIFTYKGIPYAQADRFESPKPTEAWEGIRSSLTYGPVAPLLSPTTSVNDEIEFFFNHDWGYPNEDNLVLNIWTPGINDGKKRPVMFWIHGGGFTAGSSQELPSYDGENLAKTGDIVVVSINHRLNILGFLDLSAYGDKYATSANNSILDMQMALKWVQDNIENFGGDPGNVTIFGQSGGGAKVNTLMAMPAAHGMFHKAINQSGAMRSGILERKDTQRIGAAVLQELGISPSEVDKIQEVPFEKLAAAGQKALKKVSDKMKEEGRQPTSAFGLNWGPSVDGNLLPYQVNSEAAFQLSKEIPLMIGTVKNEFIPSMRNGLTLASENEIMAYIKKTYGDKAEAYLAAIKKAYPVIKMPSDLIDADFMFRPGAVAQANMKSSVKGGADTYMYLFSWQSPYMNGKYKAMHCIELPFVFNNIDKCEQMTGGDFAAYSLADKVSKAWVQFAKTGDPNHEGLPLWPTYTESNGNTMIFDNHCEVKQHHDKDLLELMSLN